MKKSPRDILIEKARKYRESIELHVVEISKHDLNFLLRMLNDAADCLESYSDHEDFAHEIRGSLKKIKAKGEL